MRKFASTVLVIAGAFCVPRMVSAHPTTATVAGAGGGASQAPGDQWRSAYARPVPLRIKLPFPAGKSYEIIQGNHGDYTHTGFNEYAWDFAMPKNSAVCAAAAGRVVRVKEDGDSGGPSNEFFGEGNTVIIDHGGGYYSQYLHLATDSALVKEGDLVMGGQIIARSGNTGFSSVPHLHFHVQDASGRSLPVKFQDVPGDGIPDIHTSVVSYNDGTNMSQYAGESFLPPNIFATNSILLISRNLPGHLFRAGREYEIKGRLTNSTARKIAVYFMGSTGGNALYTIYAKVDRDGFFETSFDPEQLKALKSEWNGDHTQSNQFSLAIAPVKPDGSFWSDVSVPVCVR